MKAQHEIVQDAFKPVTLTLTFESAAELNAMYALVNTAQHNRHATGYSNVCVNHDVLELPLYNAVNDMCVKAFKC